MKQPIIVAVVGAKKSGKTVTIESLTRELTNRHYDVVAVKHVPEPDFTIDTEGKDTWRFAEAGAKMVISVARSEVAIIMKTKTRPPLREVLEKSGPADVVLVEGFKEAVAKNQRIHKIVVVGTQQEANEAQKVFQPIIAFAGLTGVRLKSKIPFVCLPKQRMKLADIIEETIRIEQS